MVKKVYEALISDDQDNWLRALRFLLEKEGFYVTEARTTDIAKYKIEAKYFDLCVVDVRFVDEQVFNVEGLELVRYIRNLSPKTKIIVITGYPKTIEYTRPKEADAFLLKVPATASSNFNEEFRKAVRSLIDE